MENLLDKESVQRVVKALRDFDPTLKVEVLDTNSRYVRIPKLADPHRLLREDTDVDITDGTATDDLI